MIKTEILGTLKNTASELGLGVMVLATITGALELPGRSANAYALPGQTVKVEAGNFINLNNPIRREKEEAGSEYISFEETQRTPARFGKP